VQVDVKANGKNNRTTFFPFSSDKVIFFFSVLNNEKSGAA
jgi:hypothetical protein